MINSSRVSVLRSYQAASLSLDLKAIVAKVHDCQSEGAVDVGLLLELHLVAFIVHICCVTVIYEWI